MMFMGTRAYIGIKDTDNSVRYIYNQNGKHLGKRKNELLIKFEIIPGYLLRTIC